MKTPELLNVSLTQFRQYFIGGELVGLGDDFYILNAKLTKKHNPLYHPCRFDGYMLIFCEAGGLRLNVNLKEYELKKNMLFVNTPGTIVKVTELVGCDGEDMQYTLIALSKEFMLHVSDEVRKVLIGNRSVSTTPVISVTEEYYEHLYDCSEQVKKIIQSNVGFKKEIVSSIMSGVLYLIAGLWEDANENSQESVSAQTGRQGLVFDNFMQLVEEHHMVHRNVGFYAEKLNLTPKYLSKLVKNASGRSAPEWIDLSVILEAKNLLKHSNVAIKEIVYKLNFPNQSVFYKFFKMRTGMTPSEYRNS